MNKFMNKCVLVLLFIFFIVPIFNCGTEGDVIKIGAILPLTGDAAVYGKHTQNAIDMAINDANDSGGILGKKVQVIYEDSKADPRTGVSAFNKLVDIDKVPAVIGPMGSSVALAVAPVANSKNVILLSSTASAPELSNAGPYFFRNVASDIYDGYAMASFCIEELKLSKAAIIYIQNDFGIGLKESFSKKYTDMKGEIIAAESFPQNASNFRTQILKLKNKSPDCVFIVGYKEMGTLLKQCSELALKTQFVSFAMFEDPEIVNIAGEIANGIYYTFRSYDTSLGDIHVNEFIEKYKNLYGETPDIFAALGFDATNILVLAMRKGNISGLELQKSILEIQNYPGVTGNTSFDAKGDVIKSIGIKVVNDGKFEWVERSYFAGGTK